MSLPGNDCFCLKHWSLHVFLDCNGRQDGIQATNLELGYVFGSCNQQYTLLPLGHMLKPLDLDSRSEYKSWTRSGFKTEQTSAFLLIVEGPVQAVFWGFASPPALESLHPSPLLAAHLLQHLQLHAFSSFSEALCLTGSMTKTNSGSSSMQAQDSTRSSAQRLLHVRS